MACFLLDPDSDAEDHLFFEDVVAKLQEKLFVGVVLFHLDSSNGLCVMFKLHLMH